MEFVMECIDFFLHVDTHLHSVIQAYGVWTYLLLFLIIFCETGLVVTPLLPGDSLLFAAGALAATGALDVGWLFCLLTIAAIAGDAVNYSIGHYMGPKVFSQEEGRFLKKEYLERTHQFYEKYGGTTIIIARFVPIVRTFAPFVAGVGRMTYWRFASYNVIGGIAWIGICLFAGYAFGNLPVVKENFTLVILAIIVISILPGLVEFLRQRQPSSRHSTVAAKDPATE
ncbi:MAG: DedA family protein [Candidatus Binatia bacterium]|nr:DedA family protein [Candidatus Binatia bacterium]